MCTTSRMQRRNIVETPHTMWDVPINHTLVRLGTDGQKCAPLNPFLALRHVQ